jgi:hypothetical protein
MLLQMLNGQLRDYRTYQAVQTMGSTTEKIRVKL